MTRWRRRARVLWRTAPEFLALAAVDGRAIAVEGAGCDVWDALDDWITEEDLVAALAARFATTREAVAGDIGALLRDLSGQGYVDVVD